MLVGGWGRHDAQSIKAIGTVAANGGDSRTLQVDGKPVEGHFYNKPPRGLARYTLNAGKMMP